MMEIEKADEWHEDEGASLFIRFSRNEFGEIMSEPP